MLVVWNVVAGLHSWAEHDAVFVNEVGFVFAANGADGFVRMIPGTLFSFMTG